MGKVGYLGPSPAKSLKSEWVVLQQEGHHAAENTNKRGVIYKRALQRDKGKLQHVASWTAVLITIAIQMAIAMSTGSMQRTPAAAVIAPVEVVAGAIVPDEIAMATRLEDNSSPK